SRALISATLGRNVFSIRSFDVPKILDAIEASDSMYRSSKSSHRGRALPGPQACEVDVRVETPTSVGPPLRSGCASRRKRPTIEPPKGPANTTGHASSRHRRDKEGAGGCQRKRATSHENCGEHSIDRCDGLAHPKAGTRTKGAAAPCRGSDYRTELPESTGAHYMRVCARATAPAACGAGAEAVLGARAPN